ncbi:Retrovirus-related Pol polyprotein from transposon TNT 1-94 [Vitis vinifera]|uniref:Retrovirus-related Pol polyprotein from transposon TNT 1-94 n=1 Tax=Vitis vinifera TaxID=29760 RepID=A0A438K4U5_VITVI|nr:Retrovirus-related Pol polyprotein from transposon TNT 1-94 [Vitis vinifera]
MIMSWLINSMNNDIGENFLLFGTAKDIWDAAKETYSSSENTSELFQVESAYMTSAKESSHNIQANCGTKETVQVFLGLNRELDDVRGRIMGIKPLQVSGRLFQSSGGDRQKRDRPWCDYCKKPGHYKETCWKLHGKPADWKPKPRLTEMAEHTWQWQYYRVAFTANRGGMKPWIVDTGASDHMTGDAAILQNYKPSNGHSSVHIADGSKSKIAGTGSIKLTKDLYLDSVLHDLKSGKMIGSAELCSGLYLLSCGQFSNQVSQASCVQSQILKSDNAKEYFTSSLSTYLQNHGIIHISSCVDTPQQNGVAERKNRHLLEVARCLMFSSNVPNYFWGEAILTATYLINRMPSRVLTFQSPRQLFLKQFPHTLHFLGYSPTQKGYKCYSPTNKRFYTTMDVSFFEHVFFYPKSHVQGESMNEHQVWESFLRPAQHTNVPSPVTIQSPMPIQPIAPQLANENLQVYIRRRKRQELEHGSQSTCGQYIDSNSSLPEENIGEDRAGEVLIPSIDDSTLPIALRKGVRRCTDHPIGNYVTYEGLSPSYRAFATSLDDTQVPNTIQEALKISEWKKAVQDEIDALEKNGTWTITDLPDSSLIGCQSRLVLATTGHKKCVSKWDLEEEVYMEIPPGFEESMAKNQADHTLFVKKSHAGKMAILIVYVDDIILSGNDMEELQKLKKYLSEEFEVKDLGNLKYFLVSAVSQFMHSPTEEHMEAVYRILRYLKMTPGKGLFFRKTENRDIEVYSDAIGQETSLTGGPLLDIVLLSGGNLVTWRSKKQSVVARSSAEAEYRALAQGICEGIWIKRVLSELGQTSSSPILMMCDNQAAISIVKNPCIMTGPSMLRLTDTSSQREVTSETVKLNYVPTKHQTADILTKALPRPNFEDLTCKLGLYDIYSPA